MSDIILDDLEPENRVFEDASKGQRFANYIVDMIIFYVLIVAVLLFLPDSIVDSILGRLIGISLIIILYGVTESSLNGKTVGKYITKTRAIHENGEDLSTQDAWKRALCRVIPFEALSFIGERGWHDSISKTRVIKE